MRKKGQLFNQVFIYMILIIMMGMIFLFGYKAISSISGSGNKLDDIRFKTGIESDISRYSIEYGSSERKTVSVPGNVEEVCFINKDSIGKVITSPYFVMTDSVGSGVRDNMFVFGDEPNDNFKKMFVGNVSVKGNADFICLKATGGKIKIGYRGKGSYTEIFDWE